MMIRSNHIPPILSRICADQHQYNDVIQTAMLVTGDGELLGSTSSTFVNSEGGKESIDNLGSLIADIAVDYQRLGEEFAGLDSQPQQQHHPSNPHYPYHHHQQQQQQQQQQSSSSNPKKSHLQCLLLELELGLVGVSCCVGIDCLVIAIASSNAPPGMVKARLQAVAEHVQEALSPLTETSYR